MQQYSTMHPSTYPKACIVLAPAALRTSMSDVQCILLLSVQRMRHIYHATETCHCTPVAEETEAWLFNLNSYDIDPSQTLTSRQSSLSASPRPYLRSTSKIRRCFQCVSRPIYRYVSPGPFDWNRLEFAAINDHIRVADTDHPRLSASVISELNIALSTQFTCMN
jgi:hypothetical protein